LINNKLRVVTVEVDRA